jgi:hypothetical protein
MSLMRSAIMRSPIMGVADAAEQISTGFCRMTLFFEQNRMTLAMARNKVTIEMSSNRAEVTSKSITGSKCF